MATVHEKAAAFDELIANLFQGTTETGYLWFQSMTKPVDPRDVPLSAKILRGESEKVIKRVKS